jgi:hypothetical protein
MPALRPVKLIALVVLTIGFAVAVIAGTQQTNAGAVEASHSLGPEAPKTCPTTRAPTEPFVPPSPYPAKTYPDHFWIGTKKLWTQLRKDGTWQGLPQWDDGSFRQKIFWFREGYSWHRDPQPRLEITGQRVDSLAAVAVKLGDQARNGWTNDAEHPFMVSGVNLPSVGCWKITGHYEDGELSFVVWVTE